MIQLLLVDDAKAMHIFVKDLLKSMRQISVTSAENGKEAIDLFSAGQSFDLVLLDWIMPVMDGPTTLQKFFNLGIDWPVVMMTVRNNPNDITTMLKMGARDYLMKPFTVDILIEKIMTGVGCHNERIA